MPSGTVIPNTTSYYKITAAGMDNDHRIHDAVAVVVELREIKMRVRVKEPHLKHCI